MTIGSRRLLPIILGAVLVLGGRYAVHAQVPGGQPQLTGEYVSDVVVRGNERIDANTIRVVAMLQPGQYVTRTDIQSAIRRLMATDQYDHVAIGAESDGAGGTRLVVEVQERPLVASWEFEGLQRISAREVRDTVGLTGNQPLNPQLVVRTERMIRDLLGAEGVQLAGVDTTMIPVEGQTNTYRVVFNVEEGNRLAIAEIRFEGNEAFTDEELREAMQTRQEGFFWFRQGRFDRNTFQQDLLQRLPEFYGAHGYIDFTVVSDTLEIDPVSGKARLTITVDEGEQYRLGEFAVQGAQYFPTQQLEQMFVTQSRSVLGLPFGSDRRQRGQIFDQAALADATVRVQQLYRNNGYLAAQVEPIIQRTRGPDGEPVVDVTWQIREGSPFFINRVIIEGNTYTHESVIRDQLVVLPGDLYSDDRLIQSYRSLSALGFFETPLPEPDIIPDLLSGTVDVVFRVKEKQTGSINFGTSIGGGGYGRAGGLSGFLGYSQPNLFGQAKQASLQAEYGFGRSSFTASYTDPSLFGSRNSLSTGVFHTDDRYRGVSFTEGRYVRTGASVRYGFPLFGMRWTRAFAGYSLSRYSYQARDEDDCDVGNIFCQPTAVASNLSLAVTRDTKDHPLFPTIGTRQNITIQQTGGPLGGDGNFQKIMGEAEWWTPVARLGGTAPGTRPIITTFGVQVRAGMIFGDADRFPLERFFLGGTQFGIPLRGYDESTVTPFGVFERDDPAIPSSDRLGNAFFVITGEYAMRLTDVISISAFGDAGNLWTDPSSINPSRLVRSLGVGANLVTPFGPLGIDLAYGFDKVSPGWKVHFKINQP